MVSIQQSGVKAGCEEGACLIPSFHTAYMVAAGVASMGVLCAMFVRSTPRNDPA